MKPKIKAELVEGIQRFWATVDIRKCKKYITHLHKVIPKAIELDGDATGYILILHSFSIHNVMIINSIYKH